MDRRAATAADSPISVSVPEPDRPADAGGIALPGREQPAPAGLAGDQPSTGQPARELPAGGKQASEPAGRLWPSPADLSHAISHAREGNQDAFGVIYRDIQPRLLRYLRAIVGADAEDVASEVWLHVARDLRNFQGDSDGFRGWVATIARHRASDHLRHARRRPQPATVLAEELEMLAATDDTEGRALESVATDAAVGLIAQLPRDQAEAVLLRVVVGLDAITTAKILGKRPGAVRTASYRGLRKLSSYLAKADRDAVPAMPHLTPSTPMGGLKVTREGDPE